jgi:2-oxoglutarate ferredoxin oxidoreductase subunit delta
MFLPLGRIPRYDDPRESTWGRVSFDTARCNGCNMCVRICPSSVLVLEAKKARMVTTGLVQCMACGDCAAICPDSVISMSQSYRFTGAYETRDRGELTPPRL